MRTVLNTQDRKVSKFLDKINVNFEVTLVTELLKKDGDWLCDAWKIELSRGAKPLMTDYYTGVGHRTEKPLSRADRDAGAKVLRATKNTPNQRGQSFSRKPELLSVPTAASVLYSLILDSSAAGVTFREWCSEYGYDTDSMKANEVYKACQDSYDSLHSLFNHSELETLQSLLEDY